MTITIGRVGVSTTYGHDGLAVNEPFAWSVQGDQVTLQGVHKATSDAAAVWFQSQMLGLDPRWNIDEPAVPITSTVVTALNGFYTVTSAQATLTRGSLGAGHGLVEWAVTCVKLRDSQFPTVDVSHSSAILTNHVGITTGQYLLGYPGTASGRVPFGASAATTRTTANGVVSMFHRAAEATVLYGIGRYSVAAAAFYEAAVVVSATGGTVVGRRGLDSVANAAGTISNGIIRAVVAAGTLTISFWDTSTAAWESATPFAIFDYMIAVANIVFTRLSVLKNSPEECVLRVGAYVSNRDYVTVDLALRRGDSYIRISYPTSYNRFYPTSVTALTAITGGVRSTAVISDTNYLLMTAVGDANEVTYDLVNGYVITGNPSPGGITKATIMVGYAETLGSAGIYDSDSVMSQFYRANGVSQRVSTA